MTSSYETTAGTPTGAGRPVDAAAARELVDRLHRAIDQAFDAWVDEGAGGPAEGAKSAAPTYHRPVTAPPVRMEQMARTPEPTADLDDLVDVLAPRLLDRMIPALRQALLED
ncbi:hypothetical protein GCM10022197_08820 [Microlunatus spumicola]|uniref:Uncharacterized protein n=1 Tax=Microlunatus spumicola TaxID=81499 RepID=A0ABP6WVA4_9ACTN